MRGEGTRPGLYIKAQDYQCVRKMLEAKRAEKARLTDMDEEKTADLSEGQLAEAEVLCELLSVPVWYLHRTVQEIYQNYGAEPSAWALLKEGDWEQVMTYIQNDPNKPTSSAALDDHGASTAGQVPPGKPLERLPRLGGGVAEWTKDAGLAKDLDESGVGGLDRQQDNNGGINSTMSEAQRALVEEVEQKAAVLASTRGEEAPFFPDRMPGSPTRGATKRVISSPPQPQASAVIFTSRKSLQEPSHSPAKVVAPLSKVRQRTQLLELSNAPPNRAALAKKSQEASEEAQRKRKEEREHHAQLASRAGSFHKQGGETLQKRAEIRVTKHKDTLQADDLAGRVTDANATVGLSPVARLSVEAGMPLRNQSGPGGSALEREGSSSIAIGQAPSNLQTVGRSSDERPGGVNAEGTRATVEKEGDQGRDRPDAKRAELHHRTDQKNGALTLPRHGHEVERNRRRCVKQSLDEDAGTSGHDASSGGASQSGTGESCPERIEKRLHRLRKVKEKEHQVEAKQAARKRSRTPETRGGSSDAETVSCGPWSGNEKHRGIRSMAVLVRTEEKRPIGSEKEGVAALGGRLEAAAKGLEKRKHGRREEAAKPPAAKRRALTPEQKICSNLENGSAGREVRLVSEDVANGWEAVKIPCVNAYTEDDLPDSFRYLKQNQTYDEARNYAPAPLVRLCPGCECGSPWRKDDLKDGSCGKAGSCNCTERTGGVFAYDSEGRLTETFLQRELMRLDKREMMKCERGKCPKQKAKIKDREERMNPDNVAACEGHFRPPFIVECSVRCRCSRSCINRVVQRGITARLQVFWTPDGKGWGLQCLDALPAGSFVCEYVGQVMTGNELFEINKQREWRGEKHAYPLDLDADYVAEVLVDDETGLCLDATDMGNVARFINHRCEDANLVHIPVEIDSTDHNYYHCSFFTNRDVPALEELTWDYDIDFDDEEHPLKAFRCKCGSPYCRGRV